MRNIVICDIDGTAAIMDGRIEDRRVQVEKDGSKRNSWSAFNRGIGTEPVNMPVLSVLNSMYNSGCDIVYLSGRSDYFRSKTWEWLNINKFPVGELYMRKDGDYRPDNIIKKELAINIDLDRVIFCLDDRNQVVDMWRKELGMTCFQVNYGDF